MSCKENSFNKMPPTQENEITFIAEYNKVIELYHFILQGEKEFFCHEKKLFLNLTEYCEEIFLLAGHFHLVDLDGNNIPELILSTAPFVLLLRYYEGIVYGYTFPYRGMKNMQKDGTFYFSSSADDNGKGKLEFKNEEYEYVQIWRAIGGYLTEEGKDEFYVYGEIVSEDAFDKFIDDQIESDSADWYELNEENIGRFAVNFSK